MRSDNRRSILFAMSFDHCKVHSIRLVRAAYHIVRKSRRYAAAVPGLALYADFSTLKTLAFFPETNTS